VGNGGLDSSCTGQAPVAVSCEHGNETSCSIKGREFLDKLSDLLSQAGLCPMELVSDHNCHLL
jgi:hypothetical protein